MIRMKTLPPLPPLTPNPSRLTGSGKTLWARRNFTGLHVWDDSSTLHKMLKKARLLTHPTLARRDAPYPMQGRSSETDPRFTVLGSEARTPLADVFSILLTEKR